MSPTRARSARARAIACRPGAKPPDFQLRLAAHRLLATWAYTVPFRASITDGGQFAPARSLSRNWTDANRWKCGLVSRFLRLVSRAELVGAGAPSKGSRQSSTFMTVDTMPARRGRRCLTVA